MGKKLLSILAFLCLTVSSAWAQWGGETYIATADEELDAIEVTADATLTINTGVKVTVNGGIDIKDGATLTVMGSGTLVVYGSNGSNGSDGSDGSDDINGSDGANGGTAIAGNIIIQGATVQATGGKGGNGGGGGRGNDMEYGANLVPGNGGKGGNGGNGGSAFTGAVTILSGSVQATGGRGGDGGRGGNGGRNVENGTLSGHGGNGGKGGDGSYAFAGTLTFYGGHVTATGGQGGQGGDFGIGIAGFVELSGVKGGIGSTANAFANSVDFLNDPTDGSKDVLNKHSVEFSGPDYVHSIAVKSGTADADKWSVVPNPAMTGQTVTVTYSGTKVVKGLKAKKIQPARALSEATVKDIGKIVGADGYIYDTKAAAEAASTTAVALIAYVGSAGSVDGSSATYNGLAIAMSDANGGSDCMWGGAFVTCVSQTSDSGTALTYKNGITCTSTLTDVGHESSHNHTAATVAASNNGTTALSGTSGWFLPSMGQWNLIVQGLASKKAGSTVTADLSTSGNDTYKCSNLNSVITGTGGTGFQEAKYWSSTEYTMSNTWYVDFSSGKVGSRSKLDKCYVRSCLAFTTNAADTTDEVEGTKVDTNKWTFEMLDGDVELEVEYYDGSGYFVVGSMTSWKPDLNYQLTENTSASGEYMIQNVPLTAGTELKVIYYDASTGYWTWYPAEGGNYTISDGGIYNIYFRPDYDGGSDWHYNCIYVQKVDNPTVTVTFAPEGFATYYNKSCDVTLPEGVKARVVTNKGSAEGTLVYETIADGDGENKVVPAGTAIMLQTAKSTDAQQKTLALSAKSAAAYEGTNYLHGSDVDVTTSGDGLHYKLTYGNDNTENADVFGWYWGADNGGAFTSPGHKAWLVLPADAARSFFGLPDDATTTSMLNAERLMLNEAGAWYTINGVKLDKQPTQKGVYIYGGRKVVVK